ncbi:MAG TPA: lanthionine synthetase LanC family protein [Mycobacteriales bacterium]|nr:lanthionine synthetase LanC family protein [Mycobacteriales bacterium]
MWRTPTGVYRQVPPEVATDFYLDWGVAHGIPGVVACLARADVDAGRPAAARARLDGLWRSATDLVDLDARADAGVRPLLPTFSGPRGAQYGGTASWCYGDAGAGAAFAAGSAQGSRWLDAVADALLRGADAIDRLEPGLCHGVAGLVLIACRLYHATGEERFARAAATLVERALHRDRWDPDAVTAGYGPGLLRGNAGIALALHAALSDVEPGWDMILCLS